VRKGVLEQTRRHTFVAWLLGIRQIVVAVNKMDLVDFAQPAYKKICDEYSQTTAKLKLLEVQFVPLSAVTGDNVVVRSDRMSWYEGPTLLGLLETITISKKATSREFRFIVQNVIRYGHDYRGYAGRIVAGTANVGMSVMAVPSQQETRIRDISLYDRSLDQAQAPQSVIVSVDDHLVLGRGDMLSAPDCLPTITDRIVANLIWMSRRPLRVNDSYLMRQPAKGVSATVTQLFHRIDIETFEDVSSETLQLNEIGMVRLELNRPISCDPYSQDRTTGSFVLIDPSDNNTVAAGMIVDPDLQLTEKNVGAGGDRVAHRGVVVWFTGLSGAGKSTLANAVCTELFARGMRVHVLDADLLRLDINRDLGFSKEDRDENVRRIGFIAELLAGHGVIVLVAAISPHRQAREAVRQRIENFIEVYVNTPLRVCEDRDPKGMYKKAHAGQINGFTGINDPYEEPVNPDIVLDTSEQSLGTSTQKVLNAVMSRLS
jgi:bifunctional enzyme CysN/CysC